MVFNKAKSLIRQCWIYYLIGFIVVFGIKYFYSKAGSNELTWILAPTAWWVRILSGITFEKVTGVGYVNNYFRFIIAPSCSGVQFMIIAIATLIYSFVHRMKTWKRGFCWLGLSIGVSYLLTILVNGFRIMISIYLPLYIEGTNIYNGGLTPERLHTIIGTVIYFTALITIYCIAQNISWKMAGLVESNLNRIRAGRSFIQIIRLCMTPMFWYFSIVLGIPFLNRAYANNSEGFVEYAMVLSGVCLTIVLLFCLIFMIRKYFSRQGKKMF